MNISVRDQFVDGDLRTGEEDGNRDDRADSSGTIYLL